jgi:plastocyanin
VQRKKAGLSVVVVAAALGVLLAQSGQAPAVERPRVADERILVKDNFFSPRSLTIERKETVKWVWRGHGRHNVSFTKVPEGSSKRGARARRRGRWFRTFRKTGQYKYVCTLFAGMRGSITVREPTEPAPSSN